MKKFMLIAALVAGAAGLGSNAASAATVCGWRGCVHIHSYGYGYRYRNWGYGYRPYAAYGYVPRVRFGFF